jgi:DNA polymerase (family 10)
MRTQNAEISELFTRVADFLEIEGANPFRVRAYRNAARTIDTLARSLTDLLAEGADPAELPGIGKDLSGKILEIVQTGRLSKLEALEERLPAGLHEVLRIPGLGPRKVKLLYEGLGIRDVDELQRHARMGRIRTLDGFGPKSEARILADIERMSRDRGRTSWPVAEALAQSLTDHLKASGVERIVTAGSFRRHKETVGDLDLLISCSDPRPVMDQFFRFPKIERVIARGTTRSSALLRSGLQIDLRVVSGANFGAALHYFTGSQPHNVAVRKLGQQKGLKINEYGVFEGDRRLAGESEAEVFASIGLPYIEPELREDRGEIQAALQGRLPKMLNLKDIRGDLHCHTKDSDGLHSLEEMARAAAARDYEYLAVTNHTGSLKIAGGLEAAAVRRLMQRIDELNERSGRIVLLKGMEVDILKDGRLDLPDDVLADLDFTVCSIHTEFHLPRERQTERILRAMDNPFFTILGHPSGRLLNRRPAYEVDLERLIAAAAERNCFMELNAHPDRLDLDDIHCRLAKESGVRVAISTDAHSAETLDHMRLGVAQARRGWLEPADVLNTLGLEALRRLLKRR